MAFPFLAAAGIATGGIQALGGLFGKNKAQKAIDNYQRQTLTNPEEAIGISTSGSDLVREEAGRASATAIDALRGGGVRALMGGLPSVLSNNNRMAMEGRSYLDDQINKKAYAVAQREGINQGMMEQRENADLAGLGQQLETGRQNMFSGMRGMFNGVASGLSAVPGLGGANPQVGTVNAMGSGSGLTSLSGASQLRPFANQVGGGGLSSGLTALSGAGQFQLPDMTNLTFGNL